MSLPMTADVTPFQVHPAANKFPPMDKTRFGELVEDIHEHGQLQPIASRPVSPQVVAGPDLKVPASLRSRACVALPRS